MTENREVHTTCKYILHVIANYKRTCHTGQICILGENPVKSKKIKLSLMTMSLTYPVIPCGSRKHGNAVMTLCANAFFSNAPGLR